MKKYHDLVWDASNVEHISRHNVSPDEVEQAVFGPSCHIRRGKGEGIYYAFGLAEGGRHLFIVMRDLPGGVGRVISARDMSHKERKLYRQ